MEDLVFCAVLNDGNVVWGLFKNSWQFVKKMFFVIVLTHFLQMSAFISILSSILFFSRVFQHIEINNAWKESVFRVFLVRTFMHLDWIRRHTEKMSVFSPTAGKYGLDQLRTRTLFSQWKRNIDAKWVKDKHKKPSLYVKSP